MVYLFIKYLFNTLIRPLSVLSFKTPKSTRNHSHGNSIMSTMSYIINLDLR
jgi:hypothetical protein